MRKIKNNKYNYDSAPNLFGWGGQSKAALKDSFKDAKSSVASIGEVVGGATSAFSAAYANAQTADTSALESNIDQVKGTAPTANTNDELMNEWANRQQLSHVSWKDMRGTDTLGQVMNTLGGSSAAATAGASVGGPWGAVIGGVVGLGSGIVGALTGNAKAKKKAKELNAKIDAANAMATQSLVNKTASVDALNDYTMAANYAALGGDIQTHGGDFSNGLKIINEGGTHEENPNEGVQMGVDQQGIPNLVEEGEVVWNNYVFSNRIPVPKKIREKYKIKGKQGMTFADAAKQMQKESEERPNDPISRNGLEANMGRLAAFQESIRQKKEMKKQERQYARGGKLGTLFDGYGDQTNLIPDYYIYPDIGGPMTMEGTYNKDINNLYTKSNDFYDYSNNSFSPLNINNIKPLPEYISKNSQLPDWAKQNNNNDNTKATWLRYAPVVGSAIGAIQSIASKPDYSGYNSLLEAANNTGKFEGVTANPIGNYLSYTPFDRNYYINDLNAQAGATRRALINNSNGNRATATASLLAADNNYLGNLGKLARQAEEYNLAQRQQVENFNRATNQYNSESALKAAMYNSEGRMKANSARLSGIQAAVQLKDTVDSRRQAAINANLSNFFNSLGNIGKENFSANMVNTNPGLYYSIGNNGEITYKNGYNDLTPAQREAVRQEAEKKSAKAKKKANKAAYGGYLTIK